MHQKTETGFGNRSGAGRKQKRRWEKRPPGGKPAAIRAVKGGLFIKNHQDTPLFFSTYSTSNLTRIPANANHHYIEF